MSIPSQIRAYLQPDLSMTKLVETTTTTPKPTGTDFLVKVKATSPCPRERTWPALYPDLYKTSENHIPGTEGAGTVVVAGDSSFKVGDEVFYRTDAWLKGSLAEYAAVPAANLAPKPASLSWTDAAATPLSTLTAWQGLFEHGSLDPKGLGSSPDPKAVAHNATQRVLITGAAGGVGSWAVKFAHAAGATVVAVVSGDKADDARAFGADEIVDYKITDASKWAKEDPAKREVDTIVDCVGADLPKYWDAIKNGGRFLSVVGDPAGAKPEGETKVLADAKWYLVVPRGSDLSNIGKLIEANGWKPLIDSVVGFDQAAEAFDKVDSGRTKGKVVITVS